MSASAPAGMPSDQDEHNAIRQSILDYVEGWYDADVTRMARCLHPDLVKRTLGRDEQGTWRLRRTVDAARMITLTKQGGGSDMPEPQRRYDSAILDVFRHVATAKCVSPEYVDYLHLAKVDDRWLIVNVLWELREGEMSAAP